MKFGSHKLPTGVPLSRREFLGLATTAAAGMVLPMHTAAQSKEGAQPSSLAATLTIDASSPLATMPADYAGFSYEAAQLANPQFFSAQNKELVELFHGLSANGVLRIGGGTSEFTTFSAEPPAGAPPFEVFGPDTSKTLKKGTATSAFALQNLHGFLDATGWTCLYGLNLGQGTKENAVAEAEAAQNILGSRLLAFQIGNEPDSFRNRYRPASYSPQDFVREWLAFHDAIVERVPTAKFAGPDISNKLPFLTAFAEEARRHPDVILLTGHYYAMGPAGSPAATLENLLSANPKSATMKWSAIPVVQNAMRSTTLPFRISEANSCWNGGQPGVSNVFGAALWCADAMLHFASFGVSGMNLHGGGNGMYSPIVGSPSAGFSKRPEFFGMQFANRFAGATLVRTHLECASDRVTAYSARSDPDAASVDRIAIINKTSSRIDLAGSDIRAMQHPWKMLELTAPTVEATTDVRLTRVRPSWPRHNELRIAPYSAVLLHA